MVQRGQRKEGHGKTKVRTHIKAPIDRWLGHSPAQKLPIIKLCLIIKQSPNSLAWPSKPHSSWTLPGFALANAPWTHGCPSLPDPLCFWCPSLLDTLFQDFSYWKSPPTPFHSPTPPGGAPTPTYHYYTRSLPLGKDSPRDSLHCFPFCGIPALLWPPPRIDGENCGTIRYCVAARIWWSRLDSQDLTIKDVTDFHSEVREAIYCVLRMPRGGGLSFKASADL